MIKSMVKTLVAALLVPLLISCSGGGGGGTSPSSILPLVQSTPVAVLPTSPPITTTNNTSTVAVIAIEASVDTTQKSLARESLLHKRSPKYISSSSLGVKISGPGITTQAFDVSGASPLCTGSGAGRTCTLPVRASVGTYTFTLQMYDATPVAGAIPGTANLLGVSTITKTIVINFANVLSFLVGGEASSLTNSVLYTSLPANGSLQSVGVAWIAKDFGNNIITTTGTTPYANPVTVALVESGGSGHSYISLNGVNVGLVGTLTQASDVILIKYDGGGSVGYTTTATFTASGATPSVERMSPLFLTGSASPTGAGNTANVAITEASAPVSVAYNQALTGCASVATVPGSGAGSGAAGVASVTDTVQPAGGKTCTLTISDNLGSSVSLSVTIPAGTPTCASAAVNTQITPTTVGNGTPCPFTKGNGFGTTSTATYGGASVATIDLIENNDTSTPSETDTCSGIATISLPGSIGPAGARGYVVASVNANTSCTVTVYDGNGQSLVFPITIAVQPPPTPICSDQPNGFLMGNYSGTDYVSNGTYCGFGAPYLNGSSENRYASGSPVAATNFFTIGEDNNTSGLTASLSGDCTHGGTYPTTSTAIYGYGAFTVQGIQVTGTATTANAGNHCTIIVSDTGGHSFTYTFYFYL